VLLPFLTDQPMTLSRSRSRHWPRISTAPGANVGFMYTGTVQRVRG
jgi:hypothetical protein